ncbi:sigma 54-interacting transcriptional regulator [Flavonifractor sp. An10]|uniref:sigma-54 interaction domain-containing protein n=1 Tax=Flavonifractor sp. An10 TaxID=1965537 RepID=UPI000B378DF4|nr:sigma 54-interacting transcriptional regulator [Flavonifractor sp. An10]OUQ80068.1 AAA family ATPase [Flavonifractor sp. An10]
MKKNVAVISLDAYAGQFYAQQVQELFGDRIAVCSYSVRDGSVEHMPRKYDLYMVTTDAFDSLGDMHRYVPIDGEMMEIHVTLRWDVVHRLQALPAGKKVLFVNLSDKMCREAVTRLNQLGVNQLDFDLYHPGAPEPDMSQYDFVITPQETRYVPAGAREIIDIGQRVCDSSTMIEAALRLGFEELLETPEFEQYQRDVAANTYSFDRVFARGLRLESQFEILMEILDEGIVGVNERGEVFASNHKLEEITGIPGARALQRPAAEVYPFVPFARCLAERAPQPAQVVSANGVNMNVAVAPVLRGGACIGAFATVQRFSDAENRQNELRSQLLHKGYRAKYTFDDVVGQSPAIRRCITILKKMSLTQLPVLLIGETGTGKELFAHAVHNASPRADGPFVAINCAAMPENLLESELFGYEEGAFTGARKGGKPGLFEFAHKGTLFLDEVEGMSTALQCKLLRVLQEREIMRVGGNRIVSVDVRIVAATNENLDKMVEEGTFRRDLYYRLNTLPVLIPPLREREGDLLLLIDHFRKGIGASFTLSPELERLLLTHQWRGNIRELRNVVEYFSYTGSPVVGPEELPPTFHYLPAGLPEAGGAGAQPPRLADCPQEDERFVLSRLYQADREGRSLGRDAILADAKAAGLPCSQQEVRRILSALDQAGLARVSRGRGGTRLTPAGRALCRRLETEEKL